MAKPVYTRGISEFHTDLCCAHEWSNPTESGKQTCHECNAVCYRDKDGRIISYDRPSTTKKGPEHVREDQTA